MAAVTYGEALRSHLIGKSRTAGGHGDVRINVLLDPERQFAILRMLFLDHGGGVSCSVNPTDFDATLAWMQRRTCLGHPDLTAAGDLCALRRKMSQLDVLEAERHAGVIFRAIKNSRVHSGKPINVIG
ncbi:hypothetical protein Salmuc_03316 [Salipiger mucosus DSM 16094]|uniref:Uncharacterized protein n=2 Tax=Salipiger mucosus TaxID=263378 RepID=S9RVI9_9RHOB|nr:hypothetical protein Salmuc_03316 [Salipiger mucosus DSM 16094]